MIIIFIPLLSQLKYPSSFFYICSFFFGVVSLITTVSSLHFERLIFFVKREIWYAGHEWTLFSWRWDVRPHNRGQHYEEEGCNVSRLWKLSKAAAKSLQAAYAADLSTVDHA